MSPDPRRIRIFGVPMDLGQQVRGVDMGPSAIRYAGLNRRLRALGHEVDDAGNIEVAVRNRLDQSNTSYASAIAEACNALAEAGAQACKDGVTPVFLGGDHSMSIGSVSGIATAGRTGVMWVDAHADLNTPETSPTGNIHGMPLATLVGKGLPELTGVGGEGPKIREEDTVLIGLRDLDPAEQEWLRSGDWIVYTMRDIDERGIAEVVGEALERLSHLDRLHVSFDLDSLEPNEAPGVGTPVRGGLSYREGHLLGEMIGDSGRLTSLDVVEVNPILDGQNRTAEMAVEIVESLFGKAIL